MARKVSRSRADQPQSNTVLIVFLVFSILINLTLGVFFYLSVDKVDQAEKRAKDAQTAQQGAENQRRAATETFITLLRSVVGDTTVTNDELNRMKEKLSSDANVLGEAAAWYPNGKVWKELMGTGANNPGLIGPFTDSTGKAQYTLIDRIRKLDGSLTETTKKLNDTVAAKNKLDADYKAYQAQWNAADTEQKLKTVVDQHKQELARELKKKDDTIGDLRQKLTDTTNEIQKTVTDLTNQYKARELAITATVEDTKHKIQEERREELEKHRQETLTARNTPRARVVSYDTHTNIAYVDIGSQLKVPLQLTFSIHGRDATGNANPNPKAEGEIVSILGPQLSQVKIKRVARPDAERLKLKPESADYWITDERQFVRAFDPVVKGDLCYNAIWKPFETIHVALVGEFDVDGNGTDDIQAFMNLLRGQGAQVDLYLDKANGFQPRGRLDYTTNVVIVGGLPVLSARGAANSPLANKGTELIRNAEKVQREALEKGIEVITLPRFLTRIGYSTPRALSPRVADNNSLNLQPPANPAGDHPLPGADEKKGDENK